jgi:hypothetical protein
MFSKSILGLSMASLLMASAAIAETQVTAWTDLNLRAGPGPIHKILGVIPANQTVDVQGCLEGATWCKVSFADAEGWAYGDYLTATVDEAPMALTVAGPRGDDYPHARRLRCSSRPSAGLQVKKGPGICSAGSARRLNHRVMPGPFLRFTVSRSGNVSLKTNDGMLNDQLSRAEKGTIVHLGTAHRRRLHLGFYRRQGREAAVHALEQRIEYFSKAAVCAPFRQTARFITGDAISWRLRFGIENMQPVP